MAGCPSCKYLKPESKQPGRTSGYLYLCEMRRTMVNPYRDNCSYYEEEVSRSTADQNEIFRDGKEYNNDLPNHGCDSCKFLEVDKKATDQYGNVSYHCSKKDTYVNARKDNCELWEPGYRTISEKNEIYRSGEKKSTSSDGSVGKYLIILIIVIVLGLLLSVLNK